MGADVELVGLYWTVSGPVEVHIGREWSLFDWADRCAEARKVGFSGIGIWHADLQHVLELGKLGHDRRRVRLRRERHVDQDGAAIGFMTNLQRLQVAAERLELLDQRRRALPGRQLHDQTVGLRPDAVHHVEGRDPERPEREEHEHRRDHRRREVPGA